MSQGWCKISRKTWCDARNSHGRVSLNMDGWHPREGLHGLHGDVPGDVCQRRKCTGMLPGKGGYRHWDQSGALADVVINR